MWFGVPFNMVAITKVHVRYEMINPPSIVEPFEELEGKVFVTNNSEKDKKLKVLYVELVEQYVESVNRADTDRNEIKNILSKYFLTTKGIIKAGEEQEYLFKIILPKWKRRKGKRINDWHLALHFKQKTKLAASRGSIKRNAACFLPVEGTQIPPAFGDINLLKK